jgi:hypothetical protein
VRKAPQRNRHEAHQRYPPLFQRKALAGGADKLNLDVAPAVGGPGGFVRREEQAPDEEDGDEGDGERDDEPLTPADGRVHRLQGDEVLWGGDGRGLAADVSCQGDCELAQRGVRIHQT